MSREADEMKIMKCSGTMLLMPGVEILEILRRYNTFVVLSLFSINIIIIKSRVIMT